MPGMAIERQPCQLAWSRIKRQPKEPPTPPAGSGSYIRSWAPWRGLHGVVHHVGATRAGLVEEEVAPAPEAVGEGQRDPGGEGGGDGGVHRVAPRSSTSRPGLRREGVLGDDHAVAGDDLVLLPPQAGDDPAHACTRSSPGRLAPSRQRPGAVRVAGHGGCGAGRAIPGRTIGARRDGGTMEARAMTDGSQDGRVGRLVEGVVALEGRTAGLIDRLRADANDHPGAGAAFERFAQTAAAHRERLEQHAQELGVLTGPPGSPGAAPGTSADADKEAGEAYGGVNTGRVSRALRGACLAFNDAVMGYGVLHETAHVSGSQRYPATLRIAEQHLREYAAAAQETTQLLADVVAWELRQEGQFCACECPACRLGVCWCVAHTTDAMATAWRETAPAYPSQGLRVVPSPRRPAGPGRARGGRGGGGRWAARGDDRGRDRGGAQPRPGGADHPGDRAPRRRRARNHRSKGQVNGPPGCALVAATDRWGAPSAPPLGPPNRRGGPLGARISPWPGPPQARPWRPSTSGRWPRIAVLLTDRPAAAERLSGS